MVAYCVGITDIDPFRYGLLFERFLNPERVSMPDFDTDICYERRDEVIAYVRSRYGEDRVAQIVTFGTLAARAAIRDVGRALGLPYAEVDAVAKLIPRGPKVTIAAALEGRELRERYETSDMVRRLVDTAMALEGMPRHASTHAAGGRDHGGASFLLIAACHKRGCRCYAIRYGYGGRPRTCEVRPPWLALYYHYCGC